MYVCMYVCMYVYIHTIIYLIILCYVFYTEKNQMIIGGSVQPNVNTEKSCLQECVKLNSTDCHAVDYNTVDNQCIFHSNITACNAVNTNNNYKHIRYVISQAA